MCKQAVKKKYNMLEHVSIYDLPSKKNEEGDIPY